MVKKNGYSGPFKDAIKYYGYSLRDFQEIVAFCKHSEMVVLYDLNFPKAYIANRLAKSVIVVWRFFGGELYFRIPEHVHSEKTQKFLRQEKKLNFSNKIKQGLKLPYSLLKFRTIPKNEVDSAIFNRCNFFLGLSKPEYDFLQSIWKDLPPFVQFNAMPYLEPNTCRKKKTNLILIGNSRSAFNNHLEIIEGIKNTESRKKYNFLLIFNYGSNNFYTREVRREAGKVKEFEVLEEFLSLTKFKELYASADAFVLNGHRQIAMGNVLEGLQQNIKIYLNEKNIIYAWLRDKGFHVFTVPQFFIDLDNDNAFLSHNEAMENQKLLVEFSTEQVKDTFHQTIRDIIKNHRLTEKSKSP